MDTLTDDVFGLKNDAFFDFVQAAVGQQIVDILKFQSITSTQSFIRNPNIFEMFKMNCSEPNFLKIREASCLELDNGTFVVKIGLLNNLNYLVDFLKHKQEKKIEESNYDSENLELPLGMHQNQSPWVLMVLVLFSIGFDCIGLGIVLRYCWHWD